MKLRDVFRQSRVYGGLYSEENLSSDTAIPVNKNTWLQKRLEYVKNNLKKETDITEENNSKDTPLSE